MNNQILDTDDGMLKTEQKSMLQNCNIIIKRLERNCLDCNIVLSYKTTGRYNDALRHNRCCRKCSQKGSKSYLYGKPCVLSDDTKSKISKSLMGRKLSEETKQKIKLSRKNQIFTDETRNKLRLSAINRKGETRTKLAFQNISLSKMGNKNPNWNKKGKLNHMFGNSFMRGHKMSLESKIKMSNSHLGKKLPFSDEHKRKIRESHINRLEKMGVKFSSFNIDACKYFDTLNENFGVNIQHGMNGGEFKFRGFFADGYDKIFNIWYEWDEDHHYTVSGELRKCDIKRQDEIVKYLGCTFIRIRENDGISHLK